MATIALVLALLAAVLHATWNFIVKESTDRLATVVVIGFVGFLIYAPWVYVVEGFPVGVGLPLAASSIVHVLYFASLVAAYNHTDFSIAYPVARGAAPALVAVGGFVFLGDRLGAAEIGAIAVIVAAIVWISWTPGKTLDRTGIRWALLTGLAISIYTVVDAAAVRSSGKALAYSVTLAGLSAIGLAWLALRTRSVSDVVAPLRHRPFAVTAAAALNIGAYAIVLFAATRAPVALVSAVRETSVVFGALAGVVLLKEPFARRRLVGAAAVAIGIVALGVL
ncbi:MAG: EamA family transporter [Acidimicrobiia bacterium]|nr:EamA family transporter [Acidimicrobiia bacterium]